ncbi:MAG TPA: amidohydrolase family protein [Candidatus Acidoferrum sp.]|nr:amidohydrolase family protein [Candidatus Acidoferrum sp.]
MNPRWKLLCAVTSLLGLLAYCPSSRSQARPLPGKDVNAIYDRLLPPIEKIPIVDMHAHPGYWDDTDVDAMAVTTTELDPARSRPTNAEWAAAAKALFGYPYSDLLPEHARWLDEKDDELRKQWGKEYLSKILDKVGIQVSVANRVAMDYLENNPRFRFVFFVDPFMFPFNNQKLAISPDRAVYFPIQEKALQRYLQQVGVSRLPDDFTGYEAAMHRKLEQDKEHGAVALKFEAPYFRSLVNITDPPREQAEVIYNKYHAGGVPTADEYRVFQDYIFRSLIAQAGPLHLEVHIHSAVGSGNYYHLTEGNAMDLENILRDPRYKDTIFVMIHGGFPYTEQSIWLAALPNVYLDTSEFNLLIYPAQYSRILKEWFEIFPEKIVFGSDCFPYSREIAVPETYWLAVQTARTAAAAALAEMVSEGEISEARALEIARGYFHDNTARLFGIELLSAKH